MKFHGFSVKSYEIIGWPKVKILLITTVNNDKNIS